MANNHTMVGSSSFPPPEEIIHLEDIGIEFDRPDDEIDVVGIGKPNDQGSLRNQHLTSQPNETRRQPSPPGKISGDEPLLDDTDEEDFDMGSSGDEETDGDQESFDGSSGSSLPGASSGEESDTDEVPADSCEGTKSVDETHDNKSDEDGGDSSTATSKATDSDQFTRLLQNDQGVTSLKIDRGRLEEWSALLKIDDIMVEVAKHTTLTSLCLDLEGVGPEDYAIAVRGIQSTSSITDLELTNARLDRRTASIVAEAFSANANTLTQICLTSCDFEGSGLAVLFLGMQYNSNMTHLIIKDCNLAGFAADVVSASLPLLPKLKALRLPNTEIPMYGLRFLFENIPKTKNLVELDLSNIELDMETVALLVRHLEKTKMKRIALGSCGLDPSCVDVLCTGLVGNKTVKTLTLPDNKFGNEGGTHLKKLVTENHNIRNLNVRGCGIGSEILEILNDALRYNNSMLKSVLSPEVSLAILDSIGMMNNLSGSFE